MAYDMAMLLVGGFIGFMASILTSLVNDFRQKKGKVKIYSRFIYSKFYENSTWGFIKRKNSMTFHVPIWIEVLNTSNVVKVLRDLNVVLFNNNIEICPMIQLDRSIFTITENRETFERIQDFGNKSSYSLVIQPRSIERFEVSFEIKKSEVPNKSNFDEIRLSYYDR